jgi:uncharacterized membrane protein YoaK (UPF0700 family)
MKSILIPAQPTLMSGTAGYVDTAGYLALQGLFTSHVTGNFVTLGAALIFGTSGTLVKLLALPTFCIVIVAARLMSIGLQRKGFQTLKSLLGFQVLLLAFAAMLAIGCGPFPTGDSAAALGTGLVLVAAMAIQTAVQRIALPGSPPSTVMTMTTTQIMIDLADMLQRLPEDQRSVVHARLSRMATSVFAFAAGCAIAALLFAKVGVYCFLVTPALALAALLAGIPGARGQPG